MNIYDRIQSLWKKIKNQGEEESQPASDTHEPSTDLSPYRHGTVHHHPTPHEVQHRAAEQAYWQDQLRLAKDLNVITKALNTITGWATIVGGFAALAGLVSIFLLWWTLVETIENNRLDQRAWVGISGMRLVDQAKPGVQMEFIVDTKNTGKTPALRVKIRGKYGPTVPQDLESLKAHITTAAQQGSSLISAAQVFPVSIYIPGDYLTVWTAAAINEGTVPTYIYGDIIYEDVFKSSDSHHYTRFCVVYQYRKTRPIDLQLCDQEDYNYME